MPTIYCESKGGFTKKCYPEKFYEKEICGKCRFLPVDIKCNPASFTFHSDDPRGHWDESTTPPTWCDDVQNELDKGIVHLSLDSLEPKWRSKKVKMPKEVYITDPYTGKKRRVRFDSDSYLKDRFFKRLHSLCRRLAEQHDHGWRDEDRPPGFEVGIRECMKMPVQEIINQPEMKDFKKFKPRTFSKWRREFFEMDKKENSTLKITVGRPKKNKSHPIPKIR